MHNLSIALPNTPGALARLGAALGAVGISLEGGGVFAHGSSALANFLVADGWAAQRALDAAGLPGSSVQQVLIQRLDQGLPGQLGLIAQHMAAAGVNIEVQYSDHHNQLVLVVDDFQRGLAVSQMWQIGRKPYAPQVAELSAACHPAPE